MLSGKGATRAGRLRHRIVLEKPEAAPDGGGGASVTWIPAGAFFADILPLDAAEVAAGEGLAARITHRVFVRHRAGVASGDRLRLGDRLFRILAVHDPAEDWRFLACLVEEEGR